MLRTIYSCRLHKIFFGCCYTNAYWRCYKHHILIAFVCICVKIISLTKIPLLRLSKRDKTQLRAQHNFVRRQICVIVCLASTRYATIVKKSNSIEYMDYIHARTQGGFRGFGRTPPQAQISSTLGSQLTASPLGDHKTLQKVSRQV